MKKTTAPQWKNLTALLATLATLAATVGLKWEVFAGLAVPVQVAIVAGVALAGIAYIVSDRWLAGRRAEADANRAFGEGLRAAVGDVPPQVTALVGAAPKRGADGKFAKRE
jgi:hypothetical protein